MKQIKKHLLLAVAFTFSLAFVACGGDEDEESPEVLKEQTIQDEQAIVEMENLENEIEEAEAELDAALENL